MASGVDLDVLHDSGKFPCAVYRHSYYTVCGMQALGSQKMLWPENHHSPNQHHAVVILECIPLMDALSRQCKLMRVSWTLASAILVTC